MNLVEINIVVDHPDHCAVASSFDMSQQRSLALVNAAHNLNDKVDAAALAASSGKHSLNANLLCISHVRCLEHIALKRAAKETAK